jgi:hypothetical protein
MANSTPVPATVWNEGLVLVLEDCTNEKASNT